MQSDSPWKDDNVRFTTVSLTTLFDQIGVINLNNFEKWHIYTAGRHKNCYNWTPLNLEKRQYLPHY